MILVVAYQLNGGYGAFGSFFHFGFAVAGFVCGFGISPIHMSSGFGPSGVLSFEGVNPHFRVFFVPMLTVATPLLPLQAGHLSADDCTITSNSLPHMLHVRLTILLNPSFLLHWVEQKRIMLLRGINSFPQYAHFLVFFSSIIPANQCNQARTASRPSSMCRPTALPDSGALCSCNAGSRNRPMCYRRSAQSRPGSFSGSSAS